MPKDETSPDFSNPTSIAESVPDVEGDGSIASFCATCPNWIEVQFQSRIPKNMSKLMKIAGLSAGSIRVDEAGLEYVVTDVSQEVFEKRGKLNGTGFARVELPSNIKEVQFAFGSERPDEILGVPEGEQPGDRASGEHWAVDMGRGALTGVERGINGLMRAADDLGFWVGWNPGWLKVQGEWVWMSTEEKAEFYEKYGRPEYFDFGTKRPGGTAGQITEGVTQFLVGFIPAVRAVRLVGAARVVGSAGTYMAAGAIADATVFDPHERRLSNLIQEFPQLKNPISEYLASDPNDSSAEGRLKNALEGILFGLVLDRFVAALRVLRSGINRMVVQLKAQYRYIFDTESMEAVVSVLLKAARAVEPKVTPVVQDVAKRHNGRMAGLEYRIKTEGSLADKISRDAVAEGKYYSQVATQINDVLRYTIIFPDTGYTAGVGAAVNDLIANGYKKIKFKNTWGGKGYQGINAIFQTPQGYRFELQFHTSKSHHAKEAGTHKLYEEQRSFPEGSEKWELLERQQQEVFDAVPTPPGAILLK